MAKLEIPVTFGTHGELDDFDCKAVAACRDNHGKYGHELLYILLAYVSKMLSDSFMCRITYLTLGFNSTNDIPVGIIQLKRRRFYIVGSNDADASLKIAKDVHTYDKTSCKLDHVIMIGDMLDDTTEWVKRFDDVVDALVDCIYTHVKNQRSILDKVGICYNVNYYLKIIHKKKIGGDHDKLIELVDSAYRLNLSKGK